MDNNTCKMLNIVAHQDGGFTYDLQGDAFPLKGFAVALPQRYTREIARDLTARDIHEYCADHLEILSRPGYHLGAWLLAGQSWFLEISEVVQDVYEAMRRGDERQQLAIFCLETRREIPLRPQDLVMAVNS